MIYVWIKHSEHCIYYISDHGHVLQQPSLGNTKILHVVENHHQHRDNKVFTVEEEININIIMISVLTDTSFNIDTSEEYNIMALTAPTVDNPSNTSLDKAVIDHGGNNTNTSSNLSQVRTALQLNIQFVQK